MKGSKKNYLFKLISILLPIILLLLLEGVLRVCNYGNDLSLFIPDKKQPFLLHLNSKVSLRYFIHEKNATTGNTERFLKQKPDNLIRIFIQGESTAVGFPYFHNGAFPKMLEYHIRRDFPDLNLEVINLSMTALNSYALYDFTDEIIAQKPDAVIINVGHNEYYGALGVGSTASIGSNVFVNRMGIGLRKMKTGQLISGIFSAVTPDAGTASNDETLMKRMVKAQQIPFGSTLYKAGIHQFEKNLDETLQKYEKAGIKVFLTNTVCNLKNQKPFISIEGADSIQAITFFNQGKKYVEEKNMIKAKEAFIKAKELDALRFRAPEKINEIIEKLASGYNNVEFVDVRDNFDRATPGGIIGKELMLEHLHPNLQGHFLIAEALIKVFKKSSFIYGSPTNNAYGDFSYSSLPLTAVDSLTGVYATMLLKEGWPFNESMPQEDQKEKTMEEAVAGGLAVRTIKWEEGMYQLMSEYIKKNDFHKAVKICESFVLEYPYEYACYEQTVKTCMDAKEYEKGIQYANRGLNLKKNAKTAKLLMILYMKSDQPDKAIPIIDYLAATGSPVDLKPMKDIAFKIIDCKTALQNNPNDSTHLKKEIANYYSSIGNTEAALKYN